MQGGYNIRRSKKSAAKPSFVFTGLRLEMFHMVQLYCILARLGDFAP